MNCLMKNQKMIQMNKMLVCTEFFKDGSFKKNWFCLLEDKKIFVGFI